jgi:hypothetical protein
MSTASWVITPCAYIGVSKIAGRWGASGYGSCTIPPKCAFRAGCRSVRVESLDWPQWIKARLKSLPLASSVPDSQGRLWASLTVRRLAQHALAVSSLSLSYRLVVHLRCPPHPVARMQSLRLQAGKLGLERTFTSLVAPLAGARTRTFQSASVFACSFVSGMAKLKRAKAARSY